MYPIAVGAIYVPVGSCTNMAVGTIDGIAVTGGAHDCDERRY